MASLEVPFLLSHVSTTHLLYLHTSGLSFLSPSLCCHFDHLRTLGISFHTPVLHTAFLFLCLGLVQFNTRSPLASGLTLSLPIVTILFFSYVIRLSTLFRIFAPFSGTPSA